MSSYDVKGWCPGALRPMMSGDGLVVRVRPRSGCLTATQARGIAEAARVHGNGIIDLSSRANLQLRGVSPASHGALLDALGRLDLVDRNEAIEARRNIVVAPFWDTSGVVPALASDLESALAASDLPLPGKFGFAIDGGEERVLGKVSADIRIERGVAGALVVRADGAALGVPVAPAEAASVALALAQWFIESGGVCDGRGRMAPHIGKGMIPPGTLAGSVAPVSEAQPPAPGLRADGALVAVAFGSMRAETLETLALAAAELRMTPWRMMFLPGIDRMPDGGELVIDAGDPILRVEACPGAPRCPQAKAETRLLARQLAPHVPQGAVLHVAGCAKGCACQRATALALVATADGFDLVRDGTASGVPVASGLTGGELTSAMARFLGGRDGLHL